MTMDIYSLAFDFMERIATSVVTGVIASKIIQQLGNKKMALLNSSMICPLAPQFWVGLIL